MRSAHRSSHPLPSAAGESRARARAAARFLALVFTVLVAACAGPAPAPDGPAEGRTPGATPRPLARADEPEPKAGVRRAAAPRDDDPATADLRRRVGQLRAERDAASGKAFYLRIDAPRLRLAFMLQGVTLDDYAAAGLEWGVPQVLFADRRPPAGWDEGLFTKGRLDPARERDRVEVVAPTPAPGPGAPDPSASPSAPAVPKSAEESYSVPSPYRIVFAEGVSLEVRSKGQGARNRSLVRRAADAVRLRFSDLATAVGRGPGRERVRLRVTLEADEAAALYRSLPPDVGMVVVGLPAR